MRTKLVSIRTSRKAVDAVRPFRLPVTRDHINQGIPGDKNNCAFACSFKDRFGDVLEDVEVGTRVTKIYTPGQVTRYKTPGETAVQEAIKHFDRTGLWTLPVGEYVFGVLKGTMRLGGQTSKRDRSGDKNRARSSKHQARSLVTRHSNFAKFEM